ncbi:hypothetical protein OHA21_15845 [Actinoplanes sp. NBC_00393]|uniref:hypothetical protein n=1 Tax=Actinoplanes sp. NBC_00393 TaxID=2975953 RepID=UPI002E1A07F7
MHLEEVKELVGEVCRLSDEFGASFQFEYTGEFVGTVESGRMDSGLEGHANRRAGTCHQPRETS